MSREDLHGYPLTSRLCCCEQLKPGSGTVGFITPDTIVRIAHPETGEILDPLTDGEIQIKGPQVMLGYLNNEEATRNMITQDGFLRTGDIGGFDEQGYLYIRDRAKELIKYKGFQVAPAELEDIIEGHPAVKDCTVIPVPDPEAGELPR
jgi:4-coumarate--CoA ligase